MPSDARRAARAHWREKLAWTAGLTLAFCVPYFLLQALGADRARTLPLTIVDERVAFAPAWAWVYQSGYLLMTLVPWLIDRRADLRRYAGDVLCVSALGFAIFLVMPIAGPRPAVAPDDGMYGLLVAYDGPTNAFPSLHVALLTVTMLTAARVSAGRLPAGRRTALLSTMLAWATLVAFSTLATKQHYFVDLPAGAALAWIVHRVRRLRPGVIRMRATAASLLLVLLATSASADQIPPPAPAQDEAAAHDALRQLRALYEQAIRDGRPELLAPHLAPEFHGVMVTGRVVRTLDEIRAYWTDVRALIGEGGTYTTTLLPELSLILGDTALARGTTDDVVVTSDGEEYRFSSFWTATLRREDGVWKIHQLHGSIDPVDNAFVREFSRRAILMGSAAAGVVGLALGAAIGLIAGRRKR